MTGLLPAWLLHPPTAGMFDAMSMTHTFNLALVCCTLGGLVRRFVIWRNK